MDSYIQNIDLLSAFQCLGNNKLNAIFAMNIESIILTALITMEIVIIYIVYHVSKKLYAIFEMSDLNLKSPSMFYRWTPVCKLSICCRRFNV